MGFVKRRERSEKEVSGLNFTSHIQQTCNNQLQSVESGWGLDSQSSVPWIAKPTECDAAEVQGCLITKLDEAVIGEHRK